MGDVTKSHLHELTIEERLAGLPPEQILRQIPLEQRIAGLSEQELLELSVYLSQMKRNKQ